MKSVSLFILTALATLVVAPGLPGQTMAHFAQAPVGPVEGPRFHLICPRGLEGAHQRPPSTGRYNFPLSDKEVRLVQAALLRLGIYSGEVDGIPGPDTQREVKDYQIENKLPIIGEPNQKSKRLARHFLILPSSERSKSVRPIGNICGLDQRS